MTAEAASQELLVGLDGVHCAACVRRVQQALGARVTSCEVDPATRVASIRHDPRQVTRTQVLATLAQAGFAPQLLSTAEPGSADHVAARRRSLARIGVGVFGSMQVMMFAWPAYSGTVPDAGLDALLRWAQLLVATPTVFWAGWPFLAGAARALRARTLAMDVPVALSLVIAWGASAVRVVQGEGLLYFDTATMFVALLLVGRHLEAATRARAVERLNQLADAAPAQAWRIDDAGVTPVAVSALRPGDVLRVLPGEAVPADGMLIDAAELDEALLTGESRPVTRHAGESVLAGSLNVSPRALELRVAACGPDTRVAGMLRLLRRAALRKPRVQALADRVAAHFTLAVLLMAALAGAWWLPQGLDAAIPVMIAVLVASCPCALSLAVPAALAAATARLAGRGVLVARADRLLRLADVDTVLLDKTGTLTESSLRVERCVLEGTLDEARARAIAAALEAGLAHPIARALSAMPGEAVAAVDALHIETGRGVSGRVEGRAYRLGASTPEVAAREPALTWITLCDDDTRAPLAHFGLAAPLRADAAATVAALHATGLHVELLTGDATAAAQDVARRVGITHVAAQCTPEEKLSRLRALQAQGRVVLTVGDGLNDAPFLAAADVSAAMPQGAAATQARADLVLVGERLDGLALARTVARQARVRVRENLLWAATYNLAVLPLAMLGELSPWIAAAGMSASSLLVVGNALRLRLN